MHPTCIPLAVTALPLDICCFRRCGTDFLSAPGLSTPACRRSAYWHRSPSFGGSDVLAAPCLPALPVPALPLRRGCICCWGSNHMAHQSVQRAGGCWASMKTRSKTAHYACVCCADMQIRASSCWRWAASLWSRAACRRTSGEMWRRPHA